MPSVANEKGKVKCACEQWKLVPKYYPHYQTIMQLILGIFCCWHVSLNSLLQTCIIHRCVFFSPTEMFQNFGILYSFFFTELFSSEQCGATWIKYILVGVLELFGWLVGCWVVRTEQKNWCLHACIVNTKVTSCNRSWVVKYLHFSNRIMTISRRWHGLCSFYFFCLFVVARVR